MNLFNKKQKGNLVWLDLEMTGLDPLSDRIIEIATIITDYDLNIIEEGPSLVINQPKLLMDSMDDWCINQHGKTGLTQRVLDSQITEQQAEQATLDFIKKYIYEGDSPLCGNTISQDRRFLYQYMPTLQAYLNYRHIDVSTLKELGKRWSPESVTSFSKQSTHLAMDDVRDSIAELKHYRNTLMKV